MCCCGALGRFVLFFSLSASLALILTSLLVPVWRHLSLADTLTGLTQEGLPGTLAVLCGLNPTDTDLPNHCARRFDELVWWERLGNGLSVGALCLCAACLGWGALFCFSCCCQPSFLPAIPVLSALAAVFQGAAIGVWGSMGEESGRVVRLVEEGKLDVRHLEAQTDATLSLLLAAGAEVALFVTTCAGIGLVQREAVPKTYQKYRYQKL